MYVATATDGGKAWSTAKLGRGSWKINACPMDGGQIEVATSGKAITIWRRESKIFFARPDTEEAELGEGKDPSIASGFENELYALWTGKDGVYLRTSKMGEAKLIAPGAAYPFVLFHNGGILGAWESGSGITVEILK
jgi:hypothetical protein